MFFLCFWVVIMTIGIAAEMTVIASPSQASDLPPQMPYQQQRHARIERHRRAARTTLDALLHDEGMVLLTNDILRDGDPSPPQHSEPPQLPRLQIIDGVLHRCQNESHSASTHHPADAGPPVCQPAQLRGVAGTGALFSCVQNRGIFDGPTDDAYISAMLSWGITVVRVPMNEDCIQSINGVNQSYAGAAYRAAFREYIFRLLRRGLYVILELHWTHAGSTLATEQQPMLDWDHAPAFWHIVGRMFGHRGDVIFDLHNEPYPGNNTRDSLEAWQCWKYGLSYCDVGDVPYAAIGFDDMVQLHREATFPFLPVLMLGGINYANSLIRWAEYVPRNTTTTQTYQGTSGDDDGGGGRHRHIRYGREEVVAAGRDGVRDGSVVTPLSATYDPYANIAASWHSYWLNNCNTETCWNTTIRDGVLRKGHAVITGELGELDCQGEYITPLIRWLNDKAQANAVVGVSFLAWIWAPWNCDNGPALITSYNGTCTHSYGCTYKRLLSDSRDGRHIEN